MNARTKTILCEVEGIHWVPSQAINTALTDNCVWLKITVYFFDNSEEKNRRKDEEDVYIYLLNYNVMT